MAPFFAFMDIPKSGNPLHSQILPRNSISDTQLRTQWDNPSDILSLLLLLAPDVIQRSIAQLNGRRLTPVAFSFGWVAYSVSALLSTIGDRRLMPRADYRAIVIGAESGHSRHNKSWIIGRLLRDFEQRAAPLERDKSSRNWESLRVSIFKVVPGSEAGRPTHDFVWYSGFGVMFIQLAIAIVPLCLYAEWAVLLIAVCGTLLAFSQAALSQWREEKWECPKSGGRTVTITQGNGSRQAFVILGSENALDLEILAHCDGNLSSSLSTRIISGIQAGLWMMLLITVAGLKQGSWFLLAIGTIGMLQNIYVAGSPRQPSAFGIHLEFVKTISEKKVSKVLVKVEEQYPLVGSSLLPIFYPAGFRAPPDEKMFWKEANKRRHAVMADICVNSLDGSGTDSNEQRQQGPCAEGGNQNSNEGSELLGILNQEFGTQDGQTALRTAQAVSIPS